MNIRRCPSPQVFLVMVLFALITVHSSFAGGASTGPTGASDEEQNGIVLSFLLTVGDEPGCNHVDLGDAIVAARSLSGQTVIHVKRNYSRTVSAQIVDQEVYIIGGYDTCAPSSPRSGRSVLNSAGGQILHVTSNGASARAVDLENLVLQGASGASFGGALLVEGEDLTVQLESVDVLDNSSVLRGGGIEVADRAHLVLDAGTNVLRNDSYLGGGVSCLFGARLTFLSGAIAFNEVASDLGVAKGGGVYSSGCDVQLEAGGLLQGIYANRAAEGGGLYAINGGLVFLEGGASHPADVSNNFAGGGVWINSEGSEITLLFVRNARINGNVGPGVRLESASIIGDRTSTCHTSDRCNSISFNTQEGISASSFTGGTTLVNLSQSYVEGNGTYAIGNFGQGDVVLTGSVVVSDYTAIYTNGGTLHINQSTLIGGPTTNYLLIGTGVESTMRNTIVWRAPLVSGNERSFPIQPNLRVDTNCATFDTTSGASHPEDFIRVFQQDPLFVDFDGGDYHLSLGSPSIDRCPILDNNIYRDIDGQERGFDIANTGDQTFPDDIGADEYHLAVIPSTVMFSDGFESGNMNAWSSSSP